MGVTNQKKNAIYAPGELHRVREKLGVSDAAEAKRLAEVLGGEVGVEKEETVDASKIKKPFKRSGSSANAAPPGGKKVIRRVDVADFDEDSSVKSKPKFSEPFPGDDPAVPARLGYRERVKIDQYAGQIMFEIKSPMQVFASIFSFFKEPADYVNPRFVTKRMNEHYNRIERLVTSTRNLFPKNNIKRNTQLKRSSLFVYKILDILRNWNIEQIATDIADLQSRPRNVRVTDFAFILRETYKPLFMLDDLNSESLKTAFKLVYKILYIESPMNAKEKYQEIIRNIITYIADVRQNVKYGLYPLLMKLISDRFIPFERFFIERRRRYMAFLNVTESMQLDSNDLSPQQLDRLDVETLQKNLIEEEKKIENGEAVDVDESGEPVEDPNDPKVIERKAKQEAARNEQKAMERGRNALETLFPQAGWDKLEEFPDLYPYFVSLYSLKGGYELISPTDPVQQVAVFANILDDLFIGLRYVNFGTVTGPDGTLLNITDDIAEVLNNWRRYIEDSFTRDYLPRLTEYCRMLENSEDTRMSPYAKKIMNELHWIRRLYFLPYYKFEALGPPPFQKNDVISVYAMVRKIRKVLAAVAAGIEQGYHAGGAAAKAPCNGINNPWEKYNFQIPNPTSKRLEVLLAPERRINATIILFSLSIITILDYLVNDENSWAYGNPPGPLFRSIKNEGITPVFGVDEKINADKLFRESLKKEK